MLLDDVCRGCGGRHTSCPCGHVAECAASKAQKRLKPLQLALGLVKMQGLAQLRGGIKVGLWLGEPGLGLRGDVVIF